MAKKQDAAKRRKLVQSLVSASIVDKNGKEASPLGKLRLAFAAMEERGIVAEGRWWCCGTWPESDAERFSRMGSAHGRSRQASRVWVGWVSDRILGLGT